MADKQHMTKDEVREAVRGRLGARMTVQEMARDIGCSEEMAQAAYDELEEEGRAK